MQRVMYNGHYKAHGFKVQSVVVPNGLIACLHGPYAGHKHDSTILAESNLLPQLRAAMQAAGVHYHLYGDPAYPLNDVLLTGFRGAQLTPQQELCNKQMSSVRESVEWGFGCVEMHWGYCRYPKGQQVRSHATPAHYKPAQPHARAAHPLQL